MKFILSNSDLDTSIARDFDKIEKIRIGNFSLLCNDSSTIDEDEDTTIITDGYVRDTNFESKLEQHLWAAKGISDNWPVKPNITGNFSSCIVQKKKNEIILATDHINIYPLYYLIENDRIFISNSIILIGRYSKAKFDDTGIFQRAVGPNFMNIGSRTILQHCKCLLPGERISIDDKTHTILKKYDNSLFQDINDINSGPIDFNEYWQAYKKEVDLATLEHDEINIALRGGIDSRVTLGAIESSKKLNAHTFGNSLNYESKIANRLAIIKGAESFSYFDLKSYFPKKIVLQKFTLKTEAVKLNSWIEFLDLYHNKNRKKPILIGELCEALPARNIKKFSSQDYRRKNFISNYISKRTLSFQENSEEAWSKWKEQQQKIILSWFDDNWFFKLNMTESKEQIIGETIKDTEEIFSRIENHNLPYTELFDELFSWYTYTRKELSRQVNICNDQFYACSPAMSMQLLKHTSNIHPNERLFNRFIDGLFKTIPELRNLAKIPTSQIPFVPQYSSNLIKIPIWGLRSKIDQYLVSRMMKKKKKGRYRLLQSINWLEVYQQDQALENYQSYFEPNYLNTAYKNTFFEATNKRRNLESWPFANMDIISGAVLNMEMDLIRKTPTKS